MLAMIPFTIDEVVAMGQFMASRVRAGKPFWWTFFVGDTIEGGGPDRRTKLYGASLIEQAPGAVWGVSLPLTLVISMALGIWLMFSPSMWGTSGAFADSDHLVGALVLTIAAISTAEVVRALRLLNVLLGLWLITAPWILSGATAAAQWNDVAAGVAIGILSLPRGTVRERYAGWDRFIW